MKNRSATQTLSDFFVAMRDWERSCANRDRKAKNQETTYEEAQEISIKELKDVFRKFCTTWESPNRGMQYSRPPEYNPEGENIIEVIEEGDKAVIHTQQTTTGYNNHCVYTLMRTGDGWRIVDNRQYVDSDGQQYPWDL